MEKRGEDKIASIQLHNYYTSQIQTPLLTSLVPLSSPVVHLSHKVR